MSEAENLSKKTVRELRAICKNEGVAVKSRARKAQLVEAIRRHRQAALPGPEAVEQAVAEAAPGATVRLPSGTFACRLVIDKELTLIGEATQR